MYDHVDQRSLKNKPSNLGHWIDESIDIYEKIYHKMEPDCIFTDSKREAIKKLHMRAYFDGTVKQLGHHTWLNMEQTGIAREDVCEKMEDLRNTIVKAEGGRSFTWSHAFTL